MKFSLLSTIAFFAAAATAQTNNTVTGIDGGARTLKEEATEVDDSKLNLECHEQSGNYIPSLKAGQYSTSAFHNCFRTIKQIYEFADALVAQNPKLLSKFVISKTYRGATIYGYKLTKGHSQSLYFQALQHAREWIAGSSIVFSFASILDDIANNKPTAADEYDLYFVPVVNIDGYAQTWNGNRFQRKNANQVDLNRNWPTPFENPKTPPKKASIYPGLKPFSEPETAGINSWLKTKRVLGRGLQSAMGAYTPKPAHGFYLAYGVFPDYAFREFKKPALTIEIVGKTFSVNVSTIPTHGLEVYKGINQFAKEVTVFNGGGVTSTKPSCGD
ncbi:hypothetical protein H257_11137 [Aphanomyces astaci]|uniref:Peptidase M14 domain-containing protein n=1 Tax=Aphanomyces astaci TaxID=112090 RepID=W4G4G7_APHAT|nr:hypothetical protein H257_11137 [Aphanomyces astaci]ETV74171.1 hypothetical protein H257_11137 [Aphanomyces astaci]|eukprot:XP_009836277.1 hypothetical protein H257_11137 [Aphanomyces astaci]